MRLSDLLDKGVAVAGAPPQSIEVTGITSDSRRVEAGYLFAALPGFTTDGRHFIEDALARGAVAVLAPPGVTLGAAHAAVCLLTDENPRRRLAELAARFHAPQPAQIVAVTGTNGKTSVVTFTRQLWAATGSSAASIGTLGIVGPAGRVPGALTTPDPVSLHAELARLARAGVDHVAIEASSHGLAQYRLDGLSLAAAGFTNLTRDHLDFHVSLEEYRAAKLRLFGELLPAGATAVLNADSPEFPAFEAACRARGTAVIDYGKAAGELRIHGVKPDGDGLRLDVETFGRRRRIRLALAGGFQAENALCALGLVAGGGGDWQAALDAMDGLAPPPGRMQLAARTASGAPVYVDYAHTPDALAHVLSALRPHTRRALAVVFGCGGDRDPGKRPMMGEIASRLADRVIVTDDNPRSEDPAAIRREILTACPDAREVGDRAEAVRLAIAELGTGDVLVIAGKGHESGQIVGKVVRPFDDVEAARAAAEALGGVAA